MKQTILPTDFELVAMVHQIWNHSGNLEASNIVACMASKMRITSTDEFKAGVTKQLNRLVREGEIRRVRFLPGRPHYTIA